MYFKGIIPYLKFLLQSTNAHGVHSPFIFNYVTQCLYSPQKKATNKTMHVLLQSIAYFKVKNLQIIEDLPVKKRVEKHYPNVVWKAHCLDMVYTNRLNKKEFNALLCEGKLHNNSIILVPAIYKNPETLENWKALITSPEITVSLDLFHLGVAFLRKEQTKEHFTIRI